LFAYNTFQLLSVGVRADRIYAISTECLIKNYVWINLEQYLLSNRNQIGVYAILENKLSVWMK